MKRKQFTELVHSDNSFDIRWGQSVYENGRLSGIGWFQIIDKNQRKEIEEKFKKNHPYYAREIAKKRYQTKKGKAAIKRNNKKYHHTLKGHIALSKAEEKRKTNHPNYYKEYYELHLDSIKETSGKYRKTEKGKEVLRGINRRRRHKRRGLDFIALNKHFENSHAHHIDKNYIIYIPSALHLSVRHNVWTGMGMKEINKKVFEWIIKQHMEIVYNIMKIIFKEGEV